MTSLWLLKTITWQTSLFIELLVPQYYIFIIIPLKFKLNKSIIIQLQTSAPINIPNTTHILTIKKLFLQKSYASYYFAKTACSLFIISISKILKRQKSNNKNPLCLLSSTSTTQ